MKFDGGVYFFCFRPFLEFLPKKFITQFDATWLIFSAVYPQRLEAGGLSCCSWQPLFLHCQAKETSFQLNFIPLLKLSIAETVAKLSKINLVKKCPSKLTALKPNTLNIYTDNGLLKIHSNMSDTDVLYFEQLNSFGSSARSSVVSILSP